jgi:hypothetical protein
MEQCGAHAKFSAISATERQCFDLRHCTSREAGDLRPVTKPSTAARLVILIVGAAILAGFIVGMSEATKHPSSISKPHTDSGRQLCVRNELLRPCHDEDSLLTRAPPFPPRIPKFVRVGGDSV